MLVNYMVDIGTETGLACPTQIEYVYLISEEESRPYDIITGLKMYFDALYRQLMKTCLRIYWVWFRKFVTFCLVILK